MISIQASFLGSPCLSPHPPITHTHQLLCEINEYENVIPILQMRIPISWQVPIQLKSTEIRNAEEVAGGVGRSALLSPLLPGAAWHQ